MINELLNINYVNTIFSYKPRAFTRNDDRRSPKGLYLESLVLAVAENRPLSVAWALLYLVRAPWEATQDVISQVKPCQPPKPASKILSTFPAPWPVSVSKAVSIGSLNSSFRAGHGIVSRCSLEFMHTYMWTLHMHTWLLLGFRFENW